ncbi:hypothetical protein [Lunatibacter salilacus]|uniref:hypothetical protein n=1 Tax=Lunatibacter salilacus TaxID=2483804 RepID=UPI00131C2D16|nr:hypothetical protein [Lunatibacter salilacus]
MKLSLDSKGRLSGMYDKLNLREYLLPDQFSPLLAIRIAGEYYKPDSLSMTGQELSLYYPLDNIVANVQVKAFQNYISLELTNITSANLVELVVWGPFPTIVREIIGESVGVVRNSEFAWGIQALNVKTLGGYPSQESDIEPAYDIFETGDLVDVDSEWRNKKYYRGQTAKIVENGSSLQAYTRNRQQARIIENWGHNLYTAPAFDDGGLIGSKIAFFGCPAENALATIGDIELAEGLPHPEINGEWAKTTREATSSYLIMSFDESTLDKAISFTKSAGLKYLYHGSPFRTWGHFELDKVAFPENWKSMRKYVERANAQGVHLGVHTLSNFITTNDPYVSPFPDERLALVGESVLKGSIDATTTEIEIESPDYFNQMGNNTLQAVRIGKEIIRYRAVSETAPWKLMDCIRGAFGTEASPHGSQEKVGKLMDHGYKVFLSNADLSEEIAITLARLFNETGLKQISFDGLEGVWSTGMGQYARSLFTKTWYDNLSSELQGKVINDASNPSHFNWHINTRYNWGEPWYAGFRESQTNYRLMNQDFYRRNLLPSMLGWFSMSDGTSLEDTEWLLARAAGFDAGFAFNVNFSNVERNGQSKKIFEAIRIWENARMAGAFTSEQKLRMEDVKNEYSLVEVSEVEWLLYPYEVQRYVHEQKTRQPGEPIHTIVDFNNPYSEQAIQFVMKLQLDENNNKTSNSKAEGISIEVNNFYSLEIPFALSIDQYLKLDESGILEHYDSNWNLLDSIDFRNKVIKLDEGKNTLIIDAAFTGSGNASLHIEFKTRADGERVSGKRK